MRLDLDLESMPYWAVVKTLDIIDSLLHKQLRVYNIPEITYDF